MSKHKKGSYNIYPQQPCLVDVGVGGIPMLRWETVISGRPTSHQEITAWLSDRLGMEYDSDLGAWADGYGDGNLVAVRCADEDPSHYEYLIITMKEWRLLHSKAKNKGDTRANVTRELRLETTGLLLDMLNTQRTSKYPVLSAEEVRRLTHEREGQTAAEEMKNVQPS